MKSIKNFKLFLESYSEDLSEILENDENLFVVMKGEEILSGFEFLEDCFEYISEILEGDGAISEEEKFEFDDYIVDNYVDSIEEQFEIDEFMTDLLDRFEIVEPYKIKLRSELEDTPVENDEDLDLDTDDELDSDNDSNENDIDDDFSFEVKNRTKSKKENDFRASDLLDYEKVLRESFSIVGVLENGKQEKLDTFDDVDEANDFIPEYKVVYDEYTDIKVIPNTEILENLNTNDQEKSLAMNDLDDDMEIWNKMQSCECGKKNKCTCYDQKNEISSKEDCVCNGTNNCKCTFPKETSSSIKKFNEF